MKSPRPILLVEDDPQDIELTLTALAEYNLANRIVVARDGVEALDYLYCCGDFAARPAENPVVILLDLQMPRLDGIQVLKRIKADERMRVIPIVVLTSSGEGHDLDECYNLGANAYVAKPVHFAEFVEAIKSIGVFWALINQAPASGARES